MNCVVLLLVAIIWKETRTNEMSHGIVSWRFHYIKDYFTLQSCQLSWLYPFRLYNH